MPWWQLSVQADQSQLENTETALLKLGAVSISICDAHDEPLYEPLPGEQPLWSESIISALFDQGQDIENLYDQLLADLDQRQVATLRKEELPDQQWERVHLDRYQPIRFGNRVWVCPSWVEPPQPDACNIILDPGVAFGTGSHATTALCLEYLDAHPPEGQRVMDFGCGSGVLAIAATLLGATHVDCIDIDPQALQATRDNIQRNQLDMKRFSISIDAGDDQPPVDYLIANILSGPLIELEPLFASLTESGATLLLSGILDTQVDKIESAYNQHFILNTATIRDQWCRITGVRR